LQVSHVLDEGQGVDHQAGTVGVAPESYAGGGEGEESHALGGGRRRVDQEVKFGVMHGLRVKIAAMRFREVSDEPEGGGGGGVERKVHFSISQSVVDKNNKTPFSNCGQMRILQVSNAEMETLPTSGGMNIEPVLPSRWHALDAGQPCAG
jgi:hypothetical protein